MRADREQPLYYLDPEDLIIATFVWVDDTLMRLASQGLRLPRQPKQKASYSELFTIALVIVLFGLDLYRGYRLITQAYRHLFPRTPHYSRFYRVLRNAVSLLAHLALELADPKVELFVVDLKPVPLAQGHRIHTHALPEAAAGRGPLRGFSGFALAAVMDEGGCFVRWSILPGNARETWAQELVADLTNVLGDRGLSPGGGGEDAALPPSWRQGGGDGLASMDEPGAELDRDTVQRVGAFLWAPPLGEQALLVPGGPGEPHRAGAQPGAQSRAAQDCGGGVVS